MKPHLVWDLATDPDGNVQHIAEHGVSVDEVEYVLFDPSSDTTTSRSSDNFITFGYTAGGRYLAVVWEHVLDDPLTMYPVTAYEAPEPRARKRKRRN
jgi:uncharacterized DUF497 family protein